MQKLEKNWKISLFYPLFRGIKRRIEEFQRKKIGQRNRNIYEKRVFRVEFFSSEFLWVPLTSRYKTHRKCFDEVNYMYKYIKWEEYARKIFLFLFIFSSFFIFSLLYLFFLLFFASLRILSLEFNQIFIKWFG